MAHSLTPTALSFDPTLPTPRDWAPSPALIARAKVIIAEARAELGTDLMGFSVTDLLCDRLVGLSVSQVKQIVDHVE